MTKTFDKHAHGMCEEAAAWILEGICADTIGRVLADYGAVADSLFKGGFSHNAKTYHSATFRKRLVRVLRSDETLARLFLLSLRAPWHGWWRALGTLDE
ncbi:MAG: hypothetical protein KAI66_00620, partial [Lentisphaeria bacterium]|nr:hypothetical protein [Lentisphaeria bacterium]